VEIRALFFASYRDAVGESALQVELPDGATVSDLVRSLRDRGDPFDRLPPDPAVAVNRSYTPADRSLSAGDEVAFIPPVAGG
jgi:molybdopterin converting factor subunit 1